MMTKDERIKMAFGELMVTQLMLADRIDTLTEQNKALQAQVEKPAEPAAEAPAAATTAAPAPGDA